MMIEHIVRQGLFQTTGILRGDHVAVLVAQIWYIRLCSNVSVTNK